MEKLFESAFLELLFDATNRRIEVMWLEKTAKMKDADFRELLVVYLEQVKRLQPACVLVDTRNFMFTVGVETQEWVDREINQYVGQNGVKRLAFLTSSDIFAQVSIEQTLEEYHAASLQPHFFDNYELAISWLNKSI